MKLNRRTALTLVAAAAATAAAGTALAQQRVFFGIATGGTGGTYYPLGGMLAQLISNKATVDGKKFAATAEAAGASAGMPQQFDLHAAAHQAMLDNGFIPDVPPEVTAEVAAAVEPNGPVGTGVRDLRDLPWSSIDNDTSRDLDQLEVAEKRPDGTVCVRVAIADVDTTVRQGSATDHFAAGNSTSVYTGIVTYPMLPDRLSTDLTSDRKSVV